jgi:hypothetical protein
MVTKNDIKVIYAGLQDLKRQGDTRLAGLCRQQIRKIAAHIAVNYPIHGLSEKVLEYPVKLPEDL